MKKLKWLALILIVSLIFGMVACKQSIEPPPTRFCKGMDKRRKLPLAWGNL